MSPQSHCRCWVEVDLDALRTNVAVIFRRIGRAKLMAVVKADAYGHGLTPVARTLRHCGVDAFAVANLTEAVALRQAVGPDPVILQFGAAFQFEIDALLAHNITPTISSLAEAKLFEQSASRRVNAHVEIDTGMGRCGFWHTEAVTALQQLAALPHLQITGVYTHFPSADENLTETRRQLADFLAVARDYPNLHAANSAALLNLPEATLDMVRPGLALYGIASGVADFSPVLSFKARIAHVKTVAAGRTISYGQTFVAPATMRIATVAAGYADGFSRQLSNKAEVLVAGNRCRVIGRVTMDQIVVDVTRVQSVTCGDEVVFIGQQGTAVITADEVAGWADTIAWEVLCGINQSARVPRLYRGTEPS
ncbi:MAG: alanine racemase [Verrucomicrobiota bacterium]